MKRAIDNDLIKNAKKSRASADSLVESNKTEPLTQNIEPLSPLFNTVKKKNEEEIVITDPMLFRVSKDNKSFFLLGTNHSLSFEAFTPEVKKAMLDCEKLILERANMDNPKKEFEDFIEGNLASILRTGTDSAQYIQLPEKEKEIVVNTLYVFKNALNKFNKDLSDLKDEIVIGAFIGVCTQISGEHSMELDLTNAFKKMNKSIEGLEQSKDLLEQVVEFTTWMKKTDLVMAINTFNNSKNEQCENHKTYAQGSSLRKSKYNSDAIENRNAKWFTVILAEVNKSNNSLLAVGHSHLTNPGNGLLEWLENMGFNLEKCDKEANFSPYSWKDQKSDWRIM
ncbi:MAG TPA: TraB/GumN family protein [Gammaproteobacteria bacterium]|nr:TraB/GumN family protein [Gammaproteobacteria bacterium]